jgi:hypothetical protein
MVTPRFIGRTDNLQVVSNYAVQGRPYVYIHNMTQLPIRLEDVTNGITVIEPMSKYKYKGRFDYGVALGTILNDADNIYAPFQILNPATDIYYGICSDLPQVGQDDELLWEWSFSDSPNQPYNLEFDGYT